MANKNDLPRGLVKQDQELDALMAELEKGNAPAPEATTMPQQEDRDIPVVRVDTPADDQPRGQSPDLERQLEKSEQRFRTLEGMMKAEQRRAAEVISRLEQQLADREVSAVEAPLDVRTVLSQEELSEFGESGIKVLEKIARAITTKEISKKALEVERRLADMQSRVSQAEASTSGNTTWDLVDRINPGAKEINARDTGWFTFLAEVDPVSGLTYRDIGEAASKAGDIQRLSDLIDIYRKSAKIVRPPVPVKPAQTTVAGRAHDGNRQSQRGASRTYSQEEIREFYDNRSRGVRRGITAGLSKEQLAALEADIDAAIEEGRVIL